LIVQECDDDVVQRLAELEQRGYIPLTHRVATREDFLAALKSRAWDAVISDHVLPEFSGPEALKLLRKQGSEIPFIMVSGVFGEEQAATMIRAGANDYILKENFSRLIPVLERELKAAQVRQRHPRAEQRAMVAFGDHGILETDHFGPANGENPPSENETATDAAGSPGEFPTIRELEKQHIFAALDRCPDKRTAAALLNISVRTLRNKLHKYNGTSPKPGPQMQNQADRFNAPASSGSATCRGGSSHLLADPGNGHSRIFSVPENCEAVSSPRRIL
jgi:DNA-binding NtrC family response regulator